MASGRPPTCQRTGKTARHMDFRSIYQHGFARVAACTGRVAVADPPANAEAVLRQARECSEEGVAVAVFPELTLTGYSIEDLAAAGRRARRRRGARWRTVVEGTADLLPLLVVGAPLRHRNRIYNCAVVVHRGRVLGVVPEVLPPDLPRVLRGPPARARATTSAARSALARRRRPVRHRPAVRRRRRRRARRPRRGLRGHVDPGAAERRGGAGGRDRAAQPLRQPDHRRPRRGPQAAVPLGRPRAAWPPTSTPPPGRASRRPTCRGTARR